MYTVRKLIAELSEFGPNDEVGIGMSFVTGWVQGIRRIVKDDKGRVIIDQTEESLGKEEVSFR